MLEVVSVVDGVSVVVGGVSVVVDGVLVVLEVVSVVGDADDDEAGGVLKCVRTKWVLYSSCIMYYSLLSMDCGL